MKFSKVFILVAGVPFVGCALAEAPQADEEILEKTQPQLVERSRRPRMTASLAREIELNQTVSVRIALADEPLSLASYTGGETASGVIENGQLVEGFLNGKAATLETFSQHAKSFRAMVAKANEGSQAKMAEKRQNLARKLGLEKEFSSAASTDSHVVEIDLPASVVREMSEGDFPEIALLDGVHPGTASNTPISNALSSIGVTSLAHGNGWTGAGLGLYLTDSGRPSNASCVGMGTNRYFSYANTGATGEHPTRMICVATATAPGAKIYYNNNLGGGVYGATLPAAVENGTTSPPVYASTMAYNWNCDGGYHVGDLLYDARIYATRIPHFNSAGNTGGEVCEPANAYNVISLGLVNPASPSVVSWQSAYINPDTGATKPELVAPAELISILPDVPETGGTSAATSMASAFAIDLMDQFSFLRGRPALLRAYLFANARRLGGATEIIGSADGYGMIDYSLAQYGAWYWWDMSNSGPFSQDLDGDGALEVVVSRTLSPGTYHAVISWLGSGTYTGATGNLDMDLDLRVLNSSGGLVANSSSVARNEEAVRFAVSSSGTYRFVIERYSNPTVAWPSPVAALPTDVVLGLVIRGR